MGTIHQKLLGLCHVGSALLLQTVGQEVQAQNLNSAIVQNSKLNFKNHLQHFLFAAVSTGLPPFPGWAPYLQTNTVTGAKVFGVMIHGATRKTTVSVKIGVCGIPCEETHFR